MLTGEIPEFVVREGEEVVLSCPVNTPGEVEGGKVGLENYLMVCLLQSVENITH